MAFKVRKLTDIMAQALVAAHNLRQEESVASFFHYDTTQKTTGRENALVVTDDTILSANGTNGATNLTLVNEMKAVINRHFADDFAHGSAVSAQVTTADATNDATVSTLANALKAAYNTHLTASNVHGNNDATNAVTNANATDATTASVLLNEMKGDFNAHVVSAPLGAMIRLIPA
jgi:hypothetical protein